MSPGSVIASLSSESLCFVGQSLSYSSHFSALLFCVPGMIFKVNPAPFIQATLPISVRNTTLVSR